MKRNLFLIFLLGYTLNISSSCDPKMWKDGGVEISKLHFRLKCESWLISYLKEKGISYPNPVVKQGCEIISTPTGMWCHSGSICYARVHWFQFAKSTQKQEEFSFQVKIVSRGDWLEAPFEKPIINTIPNSSNYALLKEYNYISQNAQKNTNLAVGLFAIASVIKYFSKGNSSTNSSSSNNNVSSSSSNSSSSSSSSSSTSDYAPQEITKFPYGPSNFYKKNGLEITAFASCGSYVYGPKACYRIKNTNNYRIYFKIEMILNDGDIKEGYEHSISAGEQLEFEDRWSDIGLPGVSDIRIKYAR